MKLQGLRRSRLLAGLLFVASPAMGGTLLPAIHPCPVDAPWLAHLAPAGTAGGHHHHATHGDAPAGKQQHQTCHCIGSWSAGTAVAPPAQGHITRLATVAVQVLLPGHDSSLELAPRSALLPPATAPPLA